MEIQYSEKIDPIVYGKLTDGFTRQDWLDLAEAASDQSTAAGWPEIAPLEQITQTVRDLNPEAWEDKP